MSTCRGKAIGIASVLFAYALAICVLSTYAGVAFAAAGEMPLGSVGQADSLYVRNATGDNLVAVATVNAIRLVSISGGSEGGRTFGQVEVSIRRLFHGPELAALRLVTPNVAGCINGTFGASATTDHAWLYEGDTILFWAARFDGGDGDFWCIRDALIIQTVEAGAARLYISEMGSRKAKAVVDCDGTDNRAYNQQVARRLEDRGDLVSALRLLEQVTK